MIQYIYFVKCPNCEDEHFDFFDEAKEFALGCLSQKPVITQVEVCRNDFGECTDSCDLGTIWSWEELMNDTEAEPAISVFTKDDFAEYDPIHDEEFDSLDNSLDAVPDNFRKPVPANMTVEQLVEEMEENEDTVECKWCEDLFDKSECRYEVDLGWLCSRCQAAIMSRGETLIFRENNYWDFLDESANDPLDHHDPEYAEDEAVDCLARLADGSKDAMYDQAIDALNESVYPKGLVEFDYDKLTKIIYGPKRDADDWDEVKITDSFVYYVEKADVAFVLFENFLTEEDVAEVPGGFDTLCDNNEAYDKFMKNNFDALFEKYYKKLLNYYENDAQKAFENDDYGWDDYQADIEGNRADAAYDDRHFNESKKSSMLEELEDADTYNKRLTLCPECGTDRFDQETGICINCGFNIMND